MRREKRWRYYCEFCKKSGASGGHIAKHERGCTANPNRVCGMCKVSGEDQLPLTDLVAILGKGTPDEVETLGQRIGFCPACMLSAVRASGLNDDKDELGYSTCKGFDYKKAKESFWSCVNDALAEADRSTY